ncbi:glycoside hydrolase/phage tail family protein [Ruegeria sp. WL0004]|uniref:Glycoside hydrolase/phage tail family protein n=1 Tax=Ruegeria marisflavi TaxID=2984152 RepID=A0ABT2WQB7_9RHOB|nr:glycoside hydrolase/phage tail family protein [Ruegeria sp. WL0004]MCU9838104.1 glycoside hydrolase/phage tail family protein [Ruegeria sp. WL0004]
MATILLSAAGAAIGGSIGGTVAGLSSVVLGRAVGATLGRVIDQRLLGSGASAVETGKVDRFRLTNSGEGNPVAQVHGRMRVGGQVIWASDFVETTSVSGGGKGGRSQPKTTTYSYSVSLAVALCEGEIAGVRRIWADGEEIAPAELDMRVYRGTEDQLPDPLLEVIEGADMVPAYRGTAYVVFENLALDRFGNRVPQFSFEVVRGEQPGSADHDQSLAQLVRGVALIPGTGEYSLATTQVNYSNGPGSYWAANTNSPSGQTDFVTSMEALWDELPGTGATSLVVSWFGDDLRCGSCEIKPKVERKEIDGANMPWRVSGMTRATAEEIAREADRPIYGGTPADAAVVEAIRHMNDSGQRVMFYPFILMDQLESNALPDPWIGGEGQAHLPWRGRITLSVAPGQPGSPDQSAGADAEVAAFFGVASAADFTVGEGVVTYTGSEGDWGMRRFILHYAALCAAAGGVASFCIGSEMRGLTQIRGAAGFPAVTALRALAAEVRSILGTETKIGYAADWSEYFGYQPQDGSGDRYFHLDPLWADANIDFVGIDNYMPLSDWRDAPGHADASAGAAAIYEQSYLRSNVEGGEGYHWYYHSPEAEAAQIRTPITDQAHGEPWVWRYKDIRNWWLNSHHERIGGVRQAVPTDWVPQSKPVWFTELGCAAVDKGTNQPNKFVDPKSSESSLPKHSNGARDDLIQIQYLRAVLGYWGDPAANPVSEEYGGPMIDLDNAYVWAWDARPFPAFPNNRDLWSDGTNYARGHWLNGRSGNRTLAAVVREICGRAGLAEIDVSRLWGIVRGYVVDQVSDARAALQPLMLRYGFDAIERDGTLVFRLRDGLEPVVLDPELLAVHDEIEGDRAYRRDAEVEMSGRVRLRFVQADANHDVVSEEAVLPDAATHAVSSSEMPLAMTRAEGRQTVERWLAEARVAREVVRFALPPSRMALGAGDIVSLPAADGETGSLFRLDRIEQAELQLVEAVRIEPNVYLPSDMAEDRPVSQEFVPPVPVLPVFLDLPLLSGDEVPHAPHIAVTAQPWPGTVALYSSDSDEGYELDEILAARAVIGMTESPMQRAAVGLWDRGAAVQVKLVAGALETRPLEAILSGKNLAAIGDGSSGNWELFQFRDVELIAPDTYLLRNRLRGQAGTDGVMPDVWPAGSMFVLIDPRVVQVGLSSSQRRVARHYRIGPARRGYDDPSYTHLVEAFDGIGLRPYAPAHLRVSETGGNLTARWIRRTRIDGDDWTMPEVPLGEESESYLVRVSKDGTVLRDQTITLPEWTYPAAQQGADGAVRPFDVSVAQISARFGPGAFRTITVT